MILFYQVSRCETVKTMISQTRNSSRKTQAPDPFTTSIHRSTTTACDITDCTILQIHLYFSPGHKNVFFPLLLFFFHLQNKRTGRKRKKKEKAYMRAIREEEGTYGEGGLAVLALEAGAVEDDAVGGELVHRVHRLGAHLALLLRPAKHRSLLLSSPSLFLLRRRRRRGELEDLSPIWSPPALKRAPLAASLPMAGRGYITRVSNGILRIFWASQVSTRVDAASLLPRRKGKRRERVSEADGPREVQRSLTKIRNYYCH